MALPRACLPLVVCFTVVVRLAQTEVCTHGKDGIPPTIVKSGRFGQSLEMMGELKDTEPFTSTWSRFIPDQDDNLVQQNIVLYANGKNNWENNETRKTHAATYKYEANTASFKLQFQKLSCNDKGEYQCSFQLLSGSCVTRFDVTITADPLAPVLKNDSIGGDIGSTVSVICEANVGYPAGDLYWYYYPADGSHAERLNADPPILTSAGDCRLYAKSKLTRTLTEEDHDAKIRCTSRTSSGVAIDFAETKIIINGRETITTVTPRPCVGSSCDPNEAGTLAPVKIWSYGCALCLLVLHCADLVRFS